MGRRLKTLTRIGYVGDFFPVEEELSPLIAAFFVRADEARLSYDHVQQVITEPQTTEKLNWIFMSIRMIAVSVDDAAALLKELEKQKRFTDALDEVPWRREQFDELKKVLSHSARDWHHVRDHLAGHINVDILRRALKHEGKRLLGEITIGDRAGDRRWPVLHGLVAVMLHPKEGRGLSMESIGPILANLSKAIGAVVAIEGPILAAYDSLTGGSLLTVK